LNSKEKNSILKDKIWIENMAVGHKLGKVGFSSIELELLGLG